MTETQRLAAALADASSDATSVHRLLRWFGFRGFTRGLDAHLDFLIGLAPAYTRLRELHPPLAPACDAMLRARWVRDRLSEARGAGATAADFDTGPPSVRFPLPVTLPGGDSACPMARLVLAASYLMLRIWDGHIANRPECQRILGVLASTEPLDELWRESSAASAPLGEQSVIGALEFIRNRAKTLVRLENSDQASWSELRDADAEFESLRSLLESTDARSLYGPILRNTRDPESTEDAEDDEATGDHSPDSAGASGEEKRAWGDRDSPNLHDRELLSE